MAAPLSSLLSTSYPRIVFRMSPSTSASPAPLPASPPSPRPSLYTVLGLTAGATAPEIKAAYRRMARICHPDSGGGGASSGDFIRIRDAYATLSDPEKRADYDRELFRPLRGRIFSSYSGVTSAQGGGFCCYTRRNWESDQCWW